MLLKPSCITPLRTHQTQKIADEINRVAILEFFMPTQLTPPEDITDNPFFSQTLLQTSSKSMLQGKDKRMIEVSIR